MKFRNIQVGLLLRIVFVVLIIYAVTNLVHIQQKISDTKDEIRVLTQQIADQKEINISLSNSIENSNDPSFIQDVARDKLDLVTPNDRIFYITE